MPVVEVEVDLLLLLDRLVEMVVEEPEVVQPQEMNLE
jgi:hypothetical protein